MSTFYGSNYTKITHKKQLLEKFIAFYKSPSSFRIGLEVEKLVASQTHKAIPYKDSFGPSTIKILEMMKDFWEGEEILEDGNLVALQFSGGMISLEPGGQIEYSMAPYSSILEVEKCFQEFLKIIKKMEEKLKIRFFNFGFQPFLAENQILGIPKERYSIMKKYLFKKGKLALEMMNQTASLQVSFDYENEKDMAQKFQFCQILTPILVAMYANSPFKEGKITDYHSYRTFVWEHVDPDRCGLIKSAFENDFSIEKYVDFLLDVPMMFLLRENRWIPTYGITFREFIDKGFQDFTATMGDWELHGTGLFSEIRLRPWLEVRTPDLPNDDLVLSYPTFLKGLLYDPTALNKACKRMGNPSYETVHQAQIDASKNSIKATYGGESIQELALDLLKISQEGLDHQGAEVEKKYLIALIEMIQKGNSPAMMLLEKYSGNILQPEHIL